MSDELFLSAVKRLSEGNVSLVNLIEMADGAKAQLSASQIVQLYHLWVQANPSDPLLHVALFNMAVIMSDSGDLVSARASLERAIDMRPDFYPPYINLGTLLERIGQAGEAINIWTKLANLLGNITADTVHYKLTALKQIGRVLEANQLMPNAEMVLKQSLQMDANQPDVVQHYIALRLAQCEWPILNPADNLNRKALMKNIGPLSVAIYADDPMLQLSAGHGYHQHSVGAPANDLQAHHRARQGEARPQRLRIGYVSSDLRHHAVGFIMAEMFALHNRDKYEIFAYYCGIPNEDHVKARIRDSIEHWVDIRPMSDEAAAQKILDDKIDILIDVNGYTKDARTKVFAMRPAPIIVNWLGYPGSMGTPYHHYIIADAWVIPPESEHYYSEKVLRLPCYQPNDRKREISTRPMTRTEMGLPEDGFVFCSFNGAQKISRFTFDRWMEILNGVPGSVLWLLESSEAINQRLRAAAEQHGVAPERLVFAGKLSNAEHLARYRLADLFLDTTPYGAHVTASDALWLGVPILTFAGRSFATRVCSGLVRAAGLPELVADSPEDFVARGIALGHNKEEILKLKAKLEANRHTCTLFDMQKLVQHLEGLFEGMWKDFEAGTLPRPNLTNLPIYHEIGGEFDHDTEEMLRMEDYEGYYTAALARRHDYAMISPDPRLWTPEAIAMAEHREPKAKSGSARTLPFIRKKRI